MHAHLIALAYTASAHHPGYIQQLKGGLNGTLAPSKDNGKYEAFGAVLFVAFLAAWVRSLVKKSA